VEPSRADVNALVVSPPAPIWGAQLYLLDQVDALADRGVTLTLGSPRGSDFADEWERRGHALHDLPLVLHASMRIPGTSARPGPVTVGRAGVGVVSNCWHIARAARSYDMLYSFSLRSHLETAVAGRVSRVPTALDLVDIVRPGMGQHVLRWAASLAQLTVANSTATASVLGARPTAQIIHPGIDLERFRPGPASSGLRAELCAHPEAPLVGIACRLDVRKGVQILVDAMTRLKGCAGRAQLVVVGDVGTGPAEFAERLRRESNEALGDRVRFVGRRSDMADIMRAIDVLVVASESEPFGLTALEAQASGTPVIGTDAGGLPEFVEHEVSGLLVPPFAPEPLARAIERVLAGGSTIEAMVAEAERRARPSRGLDAQYDQIAEMYRDVAARSVRRG
jgi:glycosyltransferase involved in cell wall biosynthesis